VAVTRSGTRQISGHFTVGAVQAFRVLAATQDMDVQQLMAVAINMVFERYVMRNRIPIASGRRKRDDQPVATAKRAKAKAPAKKAANVRAAPMQDSQADTA
jgi:hypothetical protein